MTRDRQGEIVELERRVDADVGEGQAVIVCFPFNSGV